MSPQQDAQRAPGKRPVASPVGPPINPPMIKNSPPIKSPDPKKARMEPEEEKPPTPTPTPVPSTMRDVDEDLGLSDGDMTPLHSSVKNLSPALDAAAENPKTPVSTSKVEGMMVS